MNYNILNLKIKLNKFVLSLFLNLIIFQNICNAQDIALHKSYHFSIQPDYSYSDRFKDKTSLTDGIYTSGRFWTSPTTVGWQSGKDVSITIDLGKAVSIQTVTFNTVRAVKSGIYFPQSIFIFISNDNNNFKYVGDAAEDPQNLAGENEVRKFVLDSIEQSARYVELTIIPQCPYIFCDEIEVLQGKKNDNSKDSIPHSSLTQFVDSLKILGYEHKTLSKAVEKMEKFSAMKNDVNEKEVDRLSTRLASKSLSWNDLKNIKEDIVKRNVNYMTRKFNVPFVIEKYNPWDTLNEFQEPKTNSGNLNYQFFICNNCAQYGSFVITNSSPILKKFYFSVSNKNTLINNIELYKVPFIPSLYYEMIPDPLVKVKGSITLNPGVSEMFLFEITGIKSGSATSSIIISSNKRNAQINIYSHILDPFDQNKFERLNVNVWAYLNKPMLINHKQEAVKDLKLHHVNTLVIPPEILPGMATIDFNGFLSYLANFGEIKNILFSMGYSSLANRRGLKNGQFMSDDWKKGFIQWYTNLKGLIKEHGFPNTQIYLYPYDEIAAANNIEDFRTLILWAKNTIPGIKFYATLNNRTAIDSILPLIDIAQIAPSLGGTNKLPPHKCEIWIYSGRTPSRAQSPYGYYRLMAWEAFVNDYKGIGFWNYADERNGNALNLISDPLPNLAGSYSVIYNNPDGSIISTRRWEAFRLGIEDYSILQLYANKFGITKAKSLANDVLSNPTDLNKADSVRNEMLSSITGNK